MEQCKTKLTIQQSNIKNILDNRIVTEKNLLLPFIFFSASNSFIESVIEVSEMISSFYLIEYFKLNTEDNPGTFLLKIKYFDISEVYCVFPRKENLSLLIYQKIIFDTMTKCLNQDNHKEAKPHSGHTFVGPKVSNRDKFCSWSLHNLVQIVKQNKQNIKQKIASQSKA